jgi:hypothetical protein
MLLLMISHCCPSKLKKELVKDIYIYITCLCPFLCGSLYVEYAVAGRQLLYIFIRELVDICRLRLSIYIGLRKKYSTSLFFDSFLLEQWNEKQKKKKKLRIHNVYSDHSFRSFMHPLDSKC